jgi:drug/metabolite transporter (DMT)-like permease
MRAQEKATLNALVAVVLWSTVATAFKIALRFLDYAQLLLCSSVTSTIVLGLLLAFTGRLGDAAASLRRHPLRSLGLGFLNPFLYYVVLFKAYDLLPAQMAQPLNYTWAIALALLSIPLLRQKIGWREIAGGLVSYAGVWVISTRGAVLGFGVASPLGVALALGSAFIWAFYWIRNTGDDRDPVVGLFSNFLFSLPMVVAFTLVVSDVRVADVRGLMAGAYVGVVEMGVTFVFWLAALKLSENTAKVGNLIFLAPFLSLVFIRFVLGEAILPSTFLGLALIVAGIVCQRVGFRPQTRPRG